MNHTESPEEIDRRVISALRNKKQTLREMLERLEMSVEKLPERPGCEHPTVTIMRIKEQTEGGAPVDQSRGRHTIEVLRTGVAWDDPELRW